MNPSPIDEIKSRISIEQVVGDYIPLKRAGMNFKALCPFHQEKTPSFMVSPEKQIWHCFGCNEGGDIFTFVQKYEGVDFKEAAQELARKAGVTLKGFAVPQDSSRKQIFYEINEAAKGFFAKHLQGSSEAARKTRDYLLSRGVSEESINAWELGLAPDAWDDVLSYLNAKKYSPNDIREAGLAIEREGKTYDRFRRRLLFPIQDAQGRVVGFTARTLYPHVYAEEDLGGKYINTPQTPLYNKSHILYGFDRAKREIKRLGYAIIVEGNMDVIMSHQAGIKNVVAASGTALTADQLKLLKRYTANIILSFDADAAGSQAVFRGITAAWELDMNVKVIVLAGAKDPADIIHHDPSAWRDAIKNSIGVVDFYFDQVLARVDLNRADHKKIAARTIMSIIGKLKTQVEQAHYVSLLAGRLSLPERVLWPLAHQETEENRPLEQREKKKLQSRSLAPAEHIISFVSRHQTYVPALIDILEPEFFPSETADLYKKIIIHYTRQRETSLRTIGSDLSPEEMQQWSELVFRGEELYGALTAQEQEREFHQLAIRIKRAFYAARLADLTENIKRAESDGRQTDVARLLTEYQSLMSQRKTLE